MQISVSVQLLLAQSVQPQISSSLRDEVDYNDDDDYYEYDEKLQEGRTASLPDKSPLLPRMSRQSSSLRSPLRSLSRQAEFLDDALLGALDDPLTERQSLIDELLSAGKIKIIIFPIKICENISRQTKTYQKSLQECSLLVTLS